MKIVRSLLSLVVLLILAVPGLAQPEPEVLGVYFDPDGILQERYAAPDELFDVFVVLRNPLAPEVWGYEFGYTVDARGQDQALVRVTNELPVLALDSGDNGAYAAGDYKVQMLAPLAAATAVVLVHWQFIMTSLIPVDINLGPALAPSLPGGVPAYDDGNSLVPLALAWTCWWDHSVKINVSCPLPVAAESFGTVKALYR